MSPGVSTWDHICRSEISPTNDWVASKRPPRVSWPRENRRTGKAVNHSNSFVAPRGREGSSILLGPSWNKSSRKPMVYLLLSQDEDASRLDGVPSREVLPGSPLDPVLEHLPLAATRRPRHTHVVPLAIAQRQRQRHCLRYKWWRRQEKCQVPLYSRHTCTGR